MSAVPTQQPSQPGLQNARQGQTELTLAGAGGPQPSTTIAPGGSTSSGVAAPGQGEDTSSALNPVAYAQPAHGLNDNILLAAMVAVFALLVLVLVTAGGHRGGWRQH